jgi:hypothetical protein
MRTLVMMRLISRRLPVTTRLRLIEEQSLIGLRSQFAMFVTIGHVVSHHMLKLLMGTSEFEIAKKRTTKRELVFHMSSLNNTETI